MKRIVAQLKKFKTIIVIKPNEKYFEIDLYSCWIKIDLKQKN